MIALGIAACAPAGQAAVIMNQVGDPAAYELTLVPPPTPSQIFTDFPDSNCTVLEDFTVSASQLLILRISALFRAQAGFVAFQDVVGYELDVFSDPVQAGLSLTGDVANVYFPAAPGMVTEVGSGSPGHGLVTLETSVPLLAAGTYWLGISPVAANSVAGQFLLMHSGAGGQATAGNSNARLANPGGELGQGTLTVLNADYAYSVTVVPEPSTASLAAIAALACLLRGGRNRRSAASH
jgi:hypothetical protein